MAYVQVSKEWLDLVRQTRLDQRYGVKRLARLAKVDPDTVDRIDKAKTRIRCVDTKWHAVISVLGLTQHWTRYAASQTGRWTPESLVRRPAFPNRRQEPVDVFLATAMESLGDTYQQARRDALDVVRVIRERLRLKVFYAAEDRPADTAFENEAWALADNCDLIESARRFVLIYPGPLAGYTKPLASSALIEVGYAIAVRVPVLVFFHKSLETLPFLLRMLPEVFEGSHLFRYRGTDDIISTLTARHRAFFPSR